MKKIFLFFGICFTLFVASKPAHAGNIFSKDPDIYTVFYTSAPTSTSFSTITVLVSLSSSSWPHPSGARAIVIDEIEFESDKTAATTSVIKIGVAREVNPSGGTIVWFETLSNGVNVSNTNPFQHIDYGIGGLSCKVNKTSSILGSTPYLFSNDLTLNSTSLVSVGAAFPSIANPAPVYALKEGDIVMSILNSAVVTNMSIQVRYHVEQQ